MYCKKIIHSIWTLEAEQQHSPLEYKQRKKKKQIWLLNSNHPFSLNDYTSTWYTTHQQVKHMTSLVNNTQFFSDVAIDLEHSILLFTARSRSLVNCLEKKPWCESRNVSFCFVWVSSIRQKSGSCCFLLLCTIKTIRENSQRDCKVHSSQKELFHQHGVLLLTLNHFQHKKQELIKKQEWSYLHTIKMTTYCKNCKICIATIKKKKKSEPV